MDKFGALRGLLPPNMERDIQIYNKLKKEDPKAATAAAATSPATSLPWTGCDKGRE